MNITIRELRTDEFTKAHQLWNRCRPSDPITARVFKRKVILDVNFDRKGYLIAEDNGELLGYIYVIVRKAPLDNDGDLSCEAADVNGFGTLPGLEKEIGPALIRAGEEYAKQRGIKKLSVSPYKPYYFTQGFDTEREPHYVNLFVNCGYRILKESYARDIDLLNYRVPDELKEKRKTAESNGYYIGALTDDLLIPFWEYMNDYSVAAFRVRIRQLMRDNDDYGRIRVVAYNGEVIGFNVFGDPDGSPERFGPFGIRSEFRGMKLGQLLLADCLYEMKCRGLHNAWMQSTGKGSAADRVYEKAGFRITRTHVVMEKDITAEV